MIDRLLAAIATLLGAATLVIIAIEDGCTWGWPQHLTYASLVLLLGVGCACLLRE